MEDREDSNCEPLVSRRTRMQPLFHADYRFGIADAGGSSMPFDEIQTTATESVTALLRRIRRRPSVPGDPRSHTPATALL